MLVLSIHPREKSRASSCRTGLSSATPAESDPTLESDSFHQNKL